MSGLPAGNGGVGTGVAVERGVREAEEREEREASEGRGAGIGAGTGRTRAGEGARLGTMPAGDVPSRLVVVPIIKLTLLSSLLVCLN